MNTKYLRLINTNPTQNSQLLMVARRSSFLIAVVALLILAACTTSKEFLETTYAQATTFAHSGNCQEAMPLFEQIYEYKEYFRPDGLEACRLITEGADRTKIEADRVISNLVKAGPYFEGTPVEAQIKRMIQKEWGAWEPNRLVNDINCAKWYETAAYLPDPEANGAELLKACGDKRAAQVPGSLIGSNFYRQLIQRYPSAANRLEAERALVDQTLRYIEKNQTALQTLSPPNKASDPALALGGDYAVVEIFNATPNTLNWVVANQNNYWIGETSRCTECTLIAEDCFKEPSLRIELPPGSYQVFVESISLYNALSYRSGGTTLQFGDTVVEVAPMEFDPYVGNWELEAGVLYSTCFAIQSE